MTKKIKILNQTVINKKKIFGPRIKTAINIQNQLIQTQKVNNKKK